jgi:hypothetical protein
MAFSIMISNAAARWAILSPVKGIFWIVRLDGKSLAIAKKIMIGILPMRRRDQKMRRKTKNLIPYTISNADFYRMRSMGKLAKDKAIQVDQIIVKSKGEKIVNKVAKALVLAAAVIFGIPVLIQVVKWYFF